MSRIAAIDPENATGKARELLDAVKSKLGMTPNMMRGMATSPAVLDGYLQFSGALAKGALSGRTRELIALTVGQANDCEYCLAAHSTIGKMVGLTPEEIEDGRRANAVDGKTKGVLALAERLVAQRGRINETDLAGARRAGLDDGAIAETIANVALNIFTNYFNNAVKTVVDFPPAPRLEQPVTACSASGCDCH